MIGSKHYFGIAKLNNIAKELYQHKLIFIKAQRVYGKENQMEHGVEELLELAAALLKAKKRNYSPEALAEVAGEMADVIIQLPIILENLDIASMVCDLIPKKIEKAEKAILKTLKERKDAQQ